VAELRGRGGEGALLLGEDIESAVLPNNAALDAFEEVYGSIH
jgi:hypothetical protein